MILQALKSLSGINAAMIPAVFLGFISVLQAGLNRRMGERIGILPAAFVNNLVLLLTTAALIIMVFFHQRAQVGVRDRALLSTPEGFSLTALIPGILGIFLVAGIPYAISKFGAIRVFLPMIAAQLIGSALWDMIAEHKSVSLNQFAGAALAFLGAVLAS